jgi:hypothetical protein
MGDPLLALAGGRIDDINIWRGEGDEPSWMGRATRFGQEDPLTLEAEGPDPASVIGQLASDLTGEALPHPPLRAAAILTAYRAELAAGPASDPADQVRIETIDIVLGLLGAGPADVPVT